MADEGVESTAREYARAVVRRKWVVVLATLVAMIVAVVLSVMQTPIYAAEAGVLIQPRGDDALFDDDVRNLNSRAIQTEIQVIEGAAVRERVVENLQLTTDPPPVDAAAVGDTDVVRLTVRDPNAENAAVYADAYANAYIEIRREQSVEALLAASNEVQSAIDSLQADIDALDDDDARRATLLAQQANFKTTLDQLRVDAALRTGGAVTIKSAEVPDAPIEPTPGRSALLAGVMGFLIGCGAALLIDRLDDKVRGTGDLEVTGVPVLGEIPNDSSDGARLAAIRAPGSPTVESYRGLRTNLQFLAIDRDLSVVQVTSSLPGEGKTTTASNLAVVLARSGNRVALVDADLRRPTVHELFDIPLAPGLTDLLLGTQPNELVHHIDLGDDNRVSVYSAGVIPANPSEMLSSKRMSRLLSEMGAHYDFVIVDTAPLLPVSDSLAMSGWIDGVLLVAQAGRASITNVQDSLARLERVHAPTLGIVLNRVSNSRLLGYTYGGYEAHELDGGTRDVVDGVTSDF